jgi:hypothetical protein
VDGAEGWHGGFFFFVEITTASGTVCQQHGFF